MAKKAINEDNPYGLTPKQQLFCKYYIKNFNATQAYINAFKAKYNTSMVEGSKALRNPNIMKEIKRLKKNVSDNTFIEAKDVFNLMVKIGFSDISDYIEWGHTVENQRDMYGNTLKDSETKENLTYIKNYVKAKDNNVLDPSIISEISQGKDGFKIKLVDKKYALDYLIKFFDLFPEKWKRKIEEEKLKLMNKDNEIESDDRPILIDSIEERFKIMKDKKDNESN